MDALRCLEIGGYPTSFHLDISSYLPNPLRLLTTRATTFWMLDDEEPQ